MILLPQSPFPVMLSVDENNIFAVGGKTKYNDSVILHRRFGRWEQLNARTSYTL